VNGDYSSLDVHLALNDSSGIGRSVVVEDRRILKRGTVALKVKQSAIARRRLGTTR
jgi:hypothetical protein